MVRQLDLVTELVGARTNAPKPVAAEVAGAEELRRQANGVEDRGTGAQLEERRVGGQAGRDHRNVMEVGPAEDSGGPRTSPNPYGSLGRIGLPEVGRSRRGPREVGRKRRAPPHPRGGR